MKKKYLLICIVIFITVLLYTYYSYFLKRTKYSFDNYFFVSGKVLAKGEHFKKEINNMNLNDNIISSNYLGVQLKLSKHELHKILNTNETNKYIRSYKKVEDLDVGIVMDSPI